MMATSTTSSGVSKPSSTPFLCSGKNLNSLKTRLATTGKFCKPSKPTPFSITNRLLDSLKPLNAGTATSTSTIPVANGGFISRFAPDEPRKGADVLVEALERAGATDVFSYPGGASMEIHQALAKSHIVRNNPCSHQQGGIFAAEGYARRSGRPGVCIATSGPGASNLVFGLADALLDSVPLVAITGQVPHLLIGTDAFQETPIVGVTHTITKHNYLVLDVEDIPRIVQEAFVLAVSGRPGPVLIAIPMDIQQQLVVSTWDKPMDIQQQLFESTWDKSMQLHGFVEPSGIPVASTLMGLGAYPLDDLLSPSMLGMHEAVRHLAFGVRFDDCVTCRAKIVHIDLEVGKTASAEIGKNKQPHILSCADLEVPLDMMSKLLEERTESMGKLNFSAGIEELEQKKKWPIWLETIGEARGSGQWATSSGLGARGYGLAIHRMWNEQSYELKCPRQWLSSSTDAFQVVEVMRTSTEHNYVDVDKDGAFFLAGSCPSPPGPVLVDVPSTITLHKYVNRMLGMHGTVYANYAVHEAIITTGVGQRQVWAEQRYVFKGSRQWATSSGLGAMGFGLPAPKLQMWSEQGYGFNGATSSGLGPMGFGVPAAIVVCAVIKKLGMVKFFVFFTQKLLEIFQFFENESKMN